jgi:hypothetical protein
MRIFQVSETFGSFISFVLGELVVDFVRV